MGFIDTIWHRWLRRPYRLAASDTGRGNKTIVFLHGVGTSGAVWQYLVGQLDATKWRIIVPDLLGFGNSPKPQWKQYTVQDHAQAVAVLLRSLGVRGHVTLVGHSMGTLVATHLAATRAHLVAHLILYQPPLYADHPEFRAHLRRREYYFALYEFVAAHPQLAFVQVQRLWRIARRLVGLHLSKEEWTPFERSLRNTIMRQTAYTELHNIRIPTDIVHGRFDLIVTRKDLRRMYTQNRNITWHTISDVHGISKRSARYLAGLINGTILKPYARHKRSRRNHTTPKDSASQIRPTVQSARRRRKGKRVA